MFRDWVYPSYVKVVRTGRNRKRASTEQGQVIDTGVFICAVLGLNTDVSLVYQLFAFLLCLAIISRITLRIHKPNVTVTRSLPRYATAHQPFEYQISITNAGDRVEADLTIVDNPKILPPDREQYRLEKEPGEETRNAYDRFIGFHRFIYLQRLNTGITIKTAKAANVSLKATVDVTVTAEPLRRGIVKFTSTNVLHPDPFGLKHGITSFDNPGSIIVLPRRYDVGRSRNVEGGRHFQPGGINASWSIGESDEFVSLRDYRDGDPVKKIHWASSAKRNKPVVKEYQDEYFIRQALVLDTSNPRTLVLEESVSVAASFLLAMNSTESMLDLIYLAETPKIITSGRGTSCIDEQLESLAMLNHSTLPLDRLSEALARHIKLVGGCILVLSDWTEEHQVMVRSLNSACIPLEIFLITDNESSLIDLPPRIHILPVGQIQEQLNLIWSVRTRAAK